MFHRFAPRWALIAAFVLLVPACMDGEGADAPTPNPIAQARPFEHVEMVVLSDADCDLIDPRPEGAGRSLTVSADEDGVVSFFALRATGSADTKLLVLDCKDPAGIQKTYSVDLSLSETFEPLDAGRMLAGTKVHMRPALAGDPAGYSDSYLLQNGYGRRPDAINNPALYAAWLEEIAKPAKLLGFKPGKGPAFAGSPSTSSNWGGLALRQSGVVYTVAAANYLIPFFSRLVSSSTEASIWTGLGGFDLDDKALVQDGIDLKTEAIAATVTPWFEYWTGSGSCQSGPCVIKGLNVHSGDLIRSEAWACDRSGNVSATGGFGCFWMVDATTNPVQIFTCTDPNGVPCKSVPAPHPFRGDAAEFIIERPSQQSHIQAPLTQYYASGGGPVSMTLAAIDSHGNIRDLGSDNYVNETLTNASGRTMETATKTGIESMTMTWNLGQ